MRGLAADASDADGIARAAQKGLAIFDLERHNNFRRMTLREIREIMEWEPVLESDPLFLEDAEIEAYQNQEPFNQVAQLPANETETKEKEE